MRLLFCTLCLLLLSLNLKAQTPNSPDCRTAIPVCADVPIVSFADGSGDVDDFDPDSITQTGCLEKGNLLGSANIENNTTWLVFRAGTDGQIGFDLESLPANGIGTPTAEWDFAVYGPDVDCVSISNGAAQPIRCNYEVNATNFTGIGVNPVSGQVGFPSLTGSQNTYDEWLDVQSGEVYYILINNFNTNFDGDPEPFMLTFTGSLVQENQNSALDCTLRDEFLGLDIIACEGDPDITLSALNSPVGSDIDTVRWSVDYDDDGVIDDNNLPGTGLLGAEFVVTSPNTGRYFARITTVSRTPPIVADDGGILITFYANPELDPANPVEILDTNLSIDPNQNNIQFNVLGNGSYEYAINDGKFQDDPIFNDVPSGLNSVIVNDKNGCGQTEDFFLVVGYPKFFTPNGDFINDTWNISGIETLDSPRVFIFDRYGKLIKQLSAVGGWDGTFNGRPMPSSDYWFRFEYGEPENGLLVAKTRTTHFTLKR